MSEYQYLEFRAIDRPLTEQELAFARKQSTRAEISRWSFHNEYNFGEFRGDANGMLRRGYDVHLHYANFGIRTLAIRLPAGLPFAKKVYSNYLVNEGLSWSTDRRSRGGILTLSPYFEAGDLDELWEFEPCIEAMVEMRTRLIAGDLRVLYLFWLVTALDGHQDPADVKEPPVPTGLAELASNAQPLLEFFGVTTRLLTAAAEVAGKATQQASIPKRIKQWVKSFSEADAKSLLCGLLSEDSADLKSATIARVLERAGSSAWPTVLTNRSCQDLLNRAAENQQTEHEKEQKRIVAAQRREAKKQARERKERVKQIADEPKKWLRKAEKLVAARGTKNYEAAAKILDELREALPTDGEQLARKHSAHLAKKHPTLNRMKSALRKRGLID